MSVARHDARSLFAAAREDGPLTHEREAVFRKVALVTGIAVGAVSATSVAPAAAAKVLSLAPSAVAKVATISPAVTSTAAFSTKGLAVGVVLGALGTVLVGLAAFSVREAEPSLRVDETTERSAAVSTVRGQALVTGATREDVPVRRKDPPNEPAAASASPTPKAPAPSDLAEEARLVTAARTALVAGEPGLALLHVQATRKLGARALEPEELGLEARALRALGRADDAAATELVLRRRYPDSALAR